MPKAKRKIVGYGDWLPGACGVQHLEDFQEVGTSYNGSREEVSQINSGGIGLLTAGFINTDECRQAFEVLCKKHKLVYRSPIRKNINSSNWFFFAVFDAGKKSDDPEFEAEWFDNDMVVSDLDVWEDGE